MATLINIYGTARSGSTMLDLILGNGADAFSCGEVYAWFRPYRRHHFTIDCSCRRSPCEVWERIGNVPENQFHATVIKELQVDFIIDSSKDLCWLIDAQKWAVTNHIKTVNLFIWKDLIDLAYSHWKRGHGLSDWCTDFIKCYRRLFELGLPFRALNYNDLVRNPQQKIREICSYVGMSYFEGKERFWEKEHHYLFGSLGVRRQVEDGNSTIRDRENFSPEFFAKFDCILEQVENNSTIQQILDILKQSDVSSATSTFDKEQQYIPKKVFPIWYYRKRMIQLLLRYFPERFDPTVP